MINEPLPSHRPELTCYSVSVDDRLDRGLDRSPYPGFDVIICVKSKS